ncbi:MAG: Ig-like domain-containing protein, partial [Micrococcales bacterium]|nr:Ig-like domain-containing protein [Micrococcales bacterium]
IVADGVDKGYLTVMIVDEDEVPLAWLAADLTCEGPAGSEITCGPFTETSTAGQYVAEVTGKKSGDYTMTASLYDRPLKVRTPDGNDIAHFIAGPPCDPNEDPDCKGALQAVLQPTTPISDSHPRVYADGEDSFTVTVTLADKEGNPVRDWTGPKVYKSADGTPAGATASWTDPVETAPGVYEVYLTSEDIAEFLLALGYDPDDKDLAIPFTDPPGNKAVFGPGPPCTEPDTSSFTLDAGPKYSEDPTSYYTGTVVLMDCQYRPITDALDNDYAKLNVFQADAGLPMISVEDLAQSATTPGTYTAKIYGTAPGSYTVDVTARVGSAATGTVIDTVPATFRPAGVDWTKSYFNATPTTEIPAGESGTITLYVFNSADEPAELTPAQLAAITATAVKTGGGAATVTLPFVATADTGVYTASVTSTVPGEYLVTVINDDGDNVALMTGGNDTLTWVPGPVDPDKTVNSLTTKDTATRDDGLDKGWAQVVVQDQYGNPIPGDNNVCLYFEFDKPGFSAIADGPRWFDEALGEDSAMAGATYVCGESDADGVVRFDAVSMYASPISTPGFEVRARYFTSPTDFVENNNDPATGGYPRYLHFSRIPIDVTKSWFTVEQTQPDTGDVIANGEDYYTVTVYLRNSYGTPVNRGSVALTISPDPSATGNQPVPAGGLNFLSGTDGTATKAITSKVDGTWTLRVLTGADELSLNIPNDPVKSADIYFKYGDPFAGNSKLSDPGYYSFADGEDTQLIKAEVRDAYGATDEGNLVPGAWVFFHVPAGVAYRCQELGGAYMLGTSPGDIVCTTGDGTGGTARGVAVLEVVSYEAITGPTEYNITAQLGTLAAPGDWIENGSPAKARFKPGTVPSELTSTLEIISDDPKVAGIENHIGRIVIRDAAGNEITADEDQATVTVEWRLVGSDGPWSQQSADTVGGTVDIEFTDTVAGTYDVRATVGGKVMAFAPGSRDTVVFSPGEPDWGNSEFNTTDNPVLADGDKTHSAWVYVRDEFGNAVPNVPIRFAVTQGAADVAGPWFGPTKNTRDYANGSTNEEGYWSVEIRSEEPGSFEVSATSGTNTLLTPAPGRQA